MIRLKLIGCWHGVRWMSAWITASPGSKIQKVDISIPVIKKPNQLLLRVKASSVNPIDSAMQSGYGDQLLSFTKQFQNCAFWSGSRYPLVCGRDCSAIVEDIGTNVTEFRKGDEVMAVIGVLDNGAHAEFALAEESNCVQKPANISHLEAACLPYTACTAWTALVTIAQIDPKNATKQKVLIHGGAGGVGTTAIQLLKSWNVSKTVATCSKDSFPMIADLGAVPVEYSDPRSLEILINQGPFDVIFDCVDSELSNWSREVLGIWRNSVYVSVVNPLLKYTDKFGVPLGLASTALEYFSNALQPVISRGQWYTYAYFMPQPECMKHIAKLLRSGEIKAIIDQKYNFEQLPAAYMKVSRKKGRGKTVIDFEIPSTTINLRQ